MKELNEEISKKDERIGELESQLRMVQVWTDDFAGSLKDRLPDEDADQKENEESVGGLQKQLTRLQSNIENGFRALEANAYEMKLKAEEAEIAKNKALEFTAMTLNNSSIVTGQQQQQQQRQRAGSDWSRSRSNNGNGNSSGRNSPYSQHTNHSDLNMVLNDSLMELDHQISMTSSSSPSIGSNSSPTLDMPDYPHHHRRARSPSVSQSQQRTSEVTRKTSRSRQNGSVSNPQPSARHYQQQHGAQSQQEPKDELTLGDAQEEIRRLNAMVDELERLIRLKINV
jgi:hypothetical protein